MSHDRSKAQRKDIVICGGTGFTALKLLEKILATRPHLQVGVTCRNQAKLSESFEHLKKRTGLSTTRVSVHLAGPDNIDQLAEVFQQYQVVVNCIGPFAYTGIQVVEAALQAHTHYVDCTGEPGFIENSFTLFHQKAQREQVVVVHACGFDSLPIDIGMVYTMKAVEDQGPFSEIKAESYLKLNNSRINLGTFKTIIASLDLLKTRHRGQAKPSAPHSAKPLKKSPKVRKLPFYSQRTNMYSVLFPGSDSYVLRKTRAILGGVYPICHCYFSVPSLLSMFLLFGFMVLICLVYLLPVSFRAGVYRYIDTLTLGAVRKDGPTEEEIAASGFQIKIFVNGVSSTNEQIAHGTLVSGPDPGYTTTPATLLVAAETIIDNLSGSFKDSGGVYTPGALFVDTNIVTRLEDEKIMFCQFSS